MHIEKNPRFIHHKSQKVASSIRELVFGMEDGMVSTFGSLTGIAAATQDHFIIILAGLIVIAVESISMAVGSYVSSKSEKSIDERKLEEEKIELKKFPKEEKAELTDLYIQDGWQPELAMQMAEHASQNKDLFLREMAYRELKVIPDQDDQPIRNGVVMLFSYIAGGIIPLLPYLIFPVWTALGISILITPVGLFTLGAVITKYSNRTWYRAGFEMMVLGGVAAAVGYGVGQLSDRLLN